MPKYDASRFRCRYCGSYYHTKAARDSCERDHD